MRINFLDLFGSFMILLGLFCIPKHRNWWLVYAFGCLCWIILCFTKQLYFGIIMNSIAMLISIKNYRKLK